MRIWKPILAFGLSVAACVVALPKSESADEVSDQGAADLVAYRGSTVLARRLSCGLPIWSRLEPTHVALFRGSEFTLEIGNDGWHGGIGSSLKVTNPRNGASAQLIESRSGAGAGWQTSYYLYDDRGDMLIVFNQASGNSFNSQWGFSGAQRRLSVQDWLPLVSDHAVINFSDPRRSKSQGTSPCGYHAQYWFDDGRASSNIHPLKTEKGPALRIDQNYELRSDTNQYWQFEDVEQALYLSMAAAVADSLRIYLVGRAGWIEGPIFPAGRFHVGHATYSECSQEGCRSNVAENLAYAMLIWSIGGTEYAMVILNSKFEIQIGNSTAVYCENTTDPACGSIDLHLWLARNTQVRIPQGTIRPYEANYYFGTLPQLRQLGFSVGILASTGETPGP